jgi:histidinol phosphatase-like enzyme (inositol monophosphatase family)
LLRARIAKKYPSHGIVGEEFGSERADFIVGEEFGSERADAEWVWVLDPIDGTKSFITGVPLYTTLVAVLQDDRPLLGVIFAPATGEIVYAAAGEPAWYAAGDQAPIRARVSQVERLAEATYVTTEVVNFDGAGKHGARQVHNQVEAACRLTRTWGDGYGYLLVATGRADVMLDPVVNLWDAAVCQPVIEGAGGHFSDWQGRPTVHTGNAVATNPQLAGLVLAITRDA